MSIFKSVVRSLSIDEWILGLSALAAVVIGILDFTPLVDIADEKVLVRMALIAIGLLMSAVVIQEGKRSAEIKALRDAVGTSSVELLSGKEFVLRAERSIARARNFVLDTTLSATYAGVTRKHPLSARDTYYYTLYKRLQNKEIVYRRIEVIFNRERLESVIFRLLVYEGMNYYLRYYDPPPEPIPVLNLLSIDHEEFFLGGFSSSDVYLGGFAFIKSAQMGPFFKAYWDNLWFSAKPLNEAGRIDWDELERIARRIGMNREEFDAMVESIKLEVSKWDGGGQIRVNPTRG